MRPTLTAALLLLLATAATAGPPRLQGIRPIGGQRGTEVEVTFSGNQMNDAQEVVFYDPGIQVESLTQVDDKNAKATLRIAPDCPLGLHDFRLRSAGGLSRLRSFSVGALPETSEAEPNSDFAAPQAIPFGCVVNGVAENEDVDYFVIEAKQGQRITAEVEGQRLGATRFDPYVAIIDAKRFELASSDDAALVGLDAVASVLAPEDGTYIVEVRESAYQGNGNCLYRLHVGPFPRPRATIPAGGRPGETLAVRWIGDVAGETTTQVAIPADAPEDFGITAQDEQGIAPYPNAFRVGDLTNVVEAEPNDDGGHANGFEAPAALNGAIGEEGDEDHFAFKAIKGQTFDITVYARRLRSPLDSVLHVAKRGGGHLAGSDDNNGPDSTIRFTAPEDGEFDVYLHDHLRNGGPTYFYRVEVTPVAPRLVVGPPNESPQRGGGLAAPSVPRGNLRAFLVNASRKDFGGELNITAEGLPPGVAMECDVMAGNLGTLPVLLTAAPDAPVGASLAKIVGTPVDTSLKVPSTCEQVSELVLGDNNVPVWTRTNDRVAVAVAEEAPFSIEIVEPKVPIVRGGAMNLKVVAHRKEGFNAKIFVRMPWNPPGISSAGRVEIPEGQSEGAIPLNADGKAELKTWRIVVDAFANAGDEEGRVAVSSQLANLRVAERFVNFAYKAAAVEQGKETDLLVEVTKLADFPGDAQVTLVGLPNKATTDVKTITKDTTELVFHIKTEPETPAGKHGNLFCQVVVMQDGEPILHNLGSGELRVDVPLPPKPEAPKPVAAAEPARPAEAPPKPLSRLEQLRLEAAERARAAGGEGQQ